MITKTVAAPPPHPITVHKTKTTRHRRKNREALNSIASNLYYTAVHQPTIHASVVADCHVHTREKNSNSPINAHCSSHYSKSKHFKTATSTREPHLLLSYTSLIVSTLYLTRHRWQPRPPFRGIERRPPPATPPTFFCQALEKPVVDVLVVELHIVPVVNGNGHAFLRHAVIPERRQVEDVLRR